MRGSAMMWAVPFLLAVIVYQARATNEAVPKTLAKDAEDSSARNKRGLNMLRLGRGLQMLRLGKRDFDEIPSSVPLYGNAAPRYLALLEEGNYYPLDQEDEGIRYRRSVDDAPYSEEDDEFEVDGDEEEVDKRALRLLRLGKRPTGKRGLGMLRLGKRRMGMLRLGKRPMGMLRLGKRPMGMLRLGKKDDDVKEEDKKALSMLRLGKKDDEVTDDKTEDVEKRRLGMLRLGRSD